ncbi:Nucleoporin NDC1 [Nakaseomyces bracarensis]|uniref:Nucleoporin NDC1 n=1 Tax=Nakaseomyces bracarensis TaxID=273131 RepID=A0ABR4P0F1_9SACH
MSEEPAPINSRYSYHTIFGDICKTRFNHLVTRLFMTSSVIELLIFSIITKGNRSMVELFFLFFPKLVILNLVSLSIIVVRKNYMHVQSLGYSNDITYVLGQIISSKTVVYLVTYILSSFLLNLTIGDWFLDESSVFTSYRFLIWFLIPVFYSTQHVLFDRDRILFTFDTQFQFPQEYILTGIPNMLARSGILSSAIVILHPFILGPLFSTWFIGLRAMVKFFMISFITFMNFEFINLGFDSHMTIGCLHKGKPISSLSSTPIETLIDGLRSKKPFTKLTAFQELAYRATSLNASLRAPIYNSRYRNQALWNYILRDCIEVIEESNTNVMKFLESLENNNTKSIKKSKDNLQTNKKYDNTLDAELFGNDISTTNISNDHRYNDFDVTRRISLKKANILIGDKNSKNKAQGNIPNYFSNNNHKYDGSIITHVPSVVRFMKDVIIYVRQKINSVFFPSATVNNTQTKTFASLFDIFLLSKKRQADRLVPLAASHGSAIIALMGILIRAYTEDPKGSVVASVGEVLKHLERSVGTLGKFADWDPKNPWIKALNIKNTDETPCDAISVLNSLSISAFLEIVLKYNVLLNDVYLDDNVVKLSKWVLDMCNSDDQQ